MKAVPFIKANIPALSGGLVINGLRTLKCIENYVKGMMK
jgi:hypothetical protein